MRRFDFPAWECGIEVINSDLRESMTHRSPVTVTRITSGVNVGAASRAVRMRSSGDGFAGVPKAWLDKQMRRSMLYCATRTIWRARRRAWGAQLSSEWTTWPPTLKGRQCRRSSAGVSADAGTGTSTRTLGVDCAGMLMRRDIVGKQHATVTRRIEMPTSAFVCHSTSHRAAITT